jgi:hypothetical protein
MPVSKASARAITPAAKGDLAIGSGTNAASVLAVGSANQVLTVDSSTATGLKWAAPSAASFAGCRLTISAFQSIAYNAIVAVTWDVETFDTDAYHSTSSNTSRITIPSGKAGKYLVNASIVWSQNSTSMCYMSLRKNNATYNWFEQTTTINGYNPQTMSDIVDCAVGDYLEIVVYTAQSGGNQLFSNATYAGITNFSATYLGA